MMRLIIGELLKLFVISSVWIVLLLLLQKTLFKKYTREFNYSIWVIILIRMLIPYQISIDISKYFDINNVTITTVCKFMRIYKRITVIVNRICSIEIIGYIWLFGIVILTVYNFINYFYLKNKILRMSSSIKEQNILSIYREILDELHIKKKIYLKRSSYNSVPFGVGVIRSYIILPDTVYTEKELRWILKHELTHFKYHDISYKLLMMIVTTIYWFNPFVYIINKIISYSCELACDERVLKGCVLAQKQEYALTILESITKTKNKRIKIGTTLGTKGFIKSRVETMFQENLRRGLALKIVIVILTVLSIINFSMGFSKLSENIDKIKHNNIFYLKDIDEERNQ